MSGDGVLGKTSDAIKGKIKQISKSTSSEVRKGVSKTKKKSRRAKWNVLLVLWASFIYCKSSRLLIFTNIISIDVNSVESQGKTGTCWSYATASFLESS